MSRLDNQRLSLVIPSYSKLDSSVLNAYYYHDLGRIHTWEVESEKH